MGTDADVQLVDPGQADGTILLQASRLTRVPPPTHAIVNFVAACTVFARTSASRACPSL